MKKETKQKKEEMSDEQKRIKTIIESQNKLAVIRLETPYSQRLLDNIN